MQEIVGHIQELKQMHKVSAVDIEDFYQPTEIFTHP